MGQLREITLGSEGTEYVRKSLRKGTGLCSSVLNMSFSGGITFAPLPEGTSLKRAKEFKTGGLTSRHNIAEWFAEHIQAVCKNRVGGSLIFQDVWSSPEFRTVNISEDKKFTNNASVYYFLEKNEINARSIGRLIGGVSSCLFIAFFSPFRIHKKELSIDKIVGDEVIDILAFYIQEVIVGAYDQEGLIIWKK